MEFLKIDTEYPAVFVRDHFILFLNFISKSKFTNIYCY